MVKQRAKRTDPSIEDRDKLVKKIEKRERRERKPKEIKSRPEHNERKPRPEKGERKPRERKTKIDPNDIAEKIRKAMEHLRAHPNISMTKVIHDIRSTKSKLHEIENRYRDDSEIGHHIKQLIRFVEEKASLRPDEEEKWRHLIKIPEEIKGQIQSMRSVKARHFKRLDIDQEVTRSSLYGIIGRIIGFHSKAIYRLVVKKPEEYREYIEEEKRLRSYQKLMTCFKTIKKIAPDKLIGMEKPLVKDMLKICASLGTSATPIQLEKNVERKSVKKEPNGWIKKPLIKF